MRAASPSSLARVPLAPFELDPDDQRAILEIQLNILEMSAGNSSDEEIFTKLCSMAEELLPNSVASIMLKQPPSGALDVLCAPSVPPEGISKLNGLVPSPSGGSCGNAVYQNNPVYVVDAINDSRCGDTREVFREFGLCACWSHPVRDSEGNSIGSFALSSFEIREPSDFHRQLLAIGACIVGIILQRIRQRDQLEFMAYNDPLTSLANRASLLKRLNAAIKEPQQNESSFAVLFLDLNRFKNINDTFGHSLGDEVLVLIAQRLRQALQETDTLARIGGDEFVLLARTPGEVEAWCQRARELLETLKNPINCQGHHFQIDGSIGIACFPQHGASAEELIKHADIAMYQAKEQGNNQISMYESRLSEKAKRAFEIERDLKTALREDGFQLHFQTQVNAQTSEVVGLEALVRWLEPNHSTISPAEFIPIAEDTGLIIPLGEWVLKKALQQTEKLIASRNQPFGVSINISGVQIFEEGVDRLLQIINNSSVPNSCIELEITETFLVQEAESTTHHLKKLQQSGVRLAIDDFGIGYSSLAYLRRFNVDTLKIDRLLINDIAADEDALAIVKAVIAMGHSLGLTVVAEGVETREQLALLQEIDCDVIQGFYFSRPAPIQTLIEQELI
ncbi:EAL domain-containing protein [Pseudomaricurvus alkylphenolicus]|uniref:sensor domain-containing phosphodiesterase n=1 Tax=Pseudomaricurvus alkylphenolicus TaxID=1306991 RepID=UPI0014203DD3|nr:EAL domain-containing protein [Pseudomaricurvus alkylphenolicus]NIB40402.1 EAL domain-containing protein [Pseudomaricurvus alkylphenolicus]